MTWIAAAFLGLIQGLTEFLPISSSAHISIIGRLIGFEDPGAGFTAVVQLGTEAAVVVFFFKDIVTIAKAWALSLVGKVPRNDPNARMGWLVILGSVPIVVIGLLFQNAIESTLRNLWFTATSLIVFGVVLAVADALSQRRKGLSELTYRDGLFYGLAQCLALIPGVSRSGGTITAGLAMGYTREAAARYSFLLAIPAVLGSGLYELFKVYGKHSESAGPFGLGETLLATAIAFVVGYIIIGWFLRYVSNNSYRGFVWYRIGLGIVVYILLGFNVLQA